MEEFENVGIEEENEPDELGDEVDDAEENADVEPDAEEEEAEFDGEFDDSDDSAAGEEAEEQKSEEEEVKGEGEEPQEQKKPKGVPNAENAKRRKEQELVKAELIEKIKREAYEKALIEANKGVNPYTGEEMKDAHDVEEYRLMREIEKNGGDPITDFPKFSKEAARKAAEQNKANEFFEKDRREFAEAYPNVDVKQLFENPKFVKYAGKRVGKEPMKEIYSDFEDLISEYKTETQKEAAKIVAKQKATPGSLRDKSGAAKQRELTDEERKALFAAAQRGVFD